MRVIKTHKKEIVIFLLVLLLELIIFTPWIKGHYATDTYRIIDIGYKEASLGSLKDGRVFMYFIANIANIINISVENYVRILLVLALICSTLSVLLLRRIVLKSLKETNIKDDIISTLLAFVTIFNFMYLENLYYAEAFVMSISVFLNILIATILIDENKNYYIKALLLQILSVFLYQGTIGFTAAIYVLFILIKYSNEYKKIIKKTIIALSCIFFAALFNILFVTILNNILGLTQVRTSNINIIKNILIIVCNMWCVLINTCGLFPKYLFAIFLLLILLIILINENKKMNKKQIIDICIITTTGILSAFSINIFLMTCFNSGRIKFSIGALIGLVLIYVYINTRKYTTDKLFKLLFILILFIYGIINVINYSNIINEHMKINQLEKLQIENIGLQIKNYEEENSKEIKCITIVKSIGSPYFEGTKSKGTLTSNAVRCSWASVGAINFYLDKNYKEEFISIYEYIELLRKNNMNRSSIAFIDDTLYIEVYDY